MDETRTTRTQPDRGAEVIYTVQITGTVPVPGPGPVPAPVPVASDKRLLAGPPQVAPRRAAHVQMHHEMHRMQLQREEKRETFEIRINQHANERRTRESWRSLGALCKS